MSTPSSSFRAGNLLSTRIRDLGLSLAGTRLEPVLAEFLQELERLRVRPRPHVYLSTEWGVPFGSILIAIPFYLARPELTAVHGERAGYLEGVGRAALLRYLRHEMGHVVSYAYKLYDREMSAAVAVTALITALAMNHVLRGRYAPCGSGPPQDSSQSGGSPTGE